MKTNVSNRTAVALKSVKQQDSLEPTRFVMTDLCQMMEASKLVLIDLGACKQCF